MNGGQDSRVQCHSPWYDFVDDGPPCRAGAYEVEQGRRPARRGGDSLIMIWPGRYLYWNGECWCANGTTPEQARSQAIGRERSLPGLSVLRWRGAVPGRDYPYDRIARYNTPRYVGTLVRSDRSTDVLQIERLEIVGTALHLQFQRTRPGREPEHFSCALPFAEGRPAFVSARPTVRGFMSQEALGVAVERLDFDANLAKLRMRMSDASVSWIYEGTLPAVAVLS